MAYWDFKDITKRTASDEILRDKAFDIAKWLYVFKRLCIFPL